MGWFSMFWPVQYISMKLQILSRKMFDTVLDATDYIIKCTHAFQGHFCRSCTSVISCLSFFIRINFWSQNIHVYLSGKERSWSRKVAIDYNKKYVTVRYGSLCEEALLIRSCFFARRVYQRREWYIWSTGWKGLISPVDFSSHKSRRSLVHRSRQVAILFCPTENWDPFNLELRRPSLKGKLDNVFYWLKVFIGPKPRQVSAYSEISCAIWSLFCEFWALWPDFFSPTLGLFDETCLMKV